MKKIRFKLLLSLALFAGVFITACEDEFSEKDALDAQQSIDLSVYVFDGYNNSGVEGASVRLIKDGDEKTSETNSLGVATFSKVKIGSNMPVKIEKEGYTSVRKMVNISGIDYRQGSYTVDVPVLSLDTNTATIKGALEIQTDLTNDSVEVPPAGTQVKAYVDLSDIGNSYVEDIELIAETDEAGNFEFTVPSNSSEGVDVDFTYSTLTLDQTIAKNRNKGQPEFPQTEPSIAEISTVFNPNGSAVSVPSVDPVYGIAPAPSGDGERGYFDDVTVNADGEVTGITIDFNKRGSGYTQADSVDITIESPFEGADGAEVRVNIAGEQLDGTWDGYRILSSGSGYPAFNNANRTYPGDNPGFDYLYNTMSDLKSGEVRVIYGYYGTGTYREQEIE